MFTKKAVISNTILFIAIVGFILLFGMAFGQINIFIGITTVTAMLMFLARDLTSHPVMNTGKLMALNLLIGVGAFFAAGHLWLAIPINFIVMFIISYFLMYNLRNPLYFPFSLQYLFLLAFPVGAEALPMRLLALLVGAVAIMALQFIVNRHKVSKSGDKKHRPFVAHL